jgi:uncharacterized protein YecT (DUF1311 family)
MKVSLAVPALLIAVASASAQELSRTYEECMRQSTTQMQNTNCAVAEMKRVEGALSAKYARALVVAVETPEAVSKIRAAQTAWESFVAAYIDALFPLENKQGEYGTSYGAKVAIWRVTLAQTQLAVLDDLIAHYRPQE